MYGKKETKTALDDNGSTLTVTENIVNDLVVLPVRRSYEIKVRVHNKREEHEEFIKFSDEFEASPSMLDLGFKIERSKIGKDNGYYYIVRCYTQLEY